MNVNTELAYAAHRVSALNEQLPEAQRLDIAAEWVELQSELDRCRSDGGRELTLIEWRGRVEGRLAQRLAHAPLEERSSYETKQSRRRSDNDRRPDYPPTRGGPRRGC